MKKTPLILSLLLCVCAVVVHAAEPEPKVYYPTPTPVATEAAAAAPNQPVMTTVLYLGFLGAMAYAAYWMWRKKVVPQSTIKSVASRLDIITSRPLGNRQFLVVVRYNDKELLLGVGPGFINKLDGDVAPTQGEGR